MEITLNVYYTVAIAILILMVGEFIKKRCEILRRFCIPVPVIGGLLFTLVLTVLTVTGVLSLTIDKSFNEFFSLLFYAGVGYTASWTLLKKGGPQVLIFLALSAVLVLLQNGLGVALCHVMHIDPLIGLATGSIPMVGGHGTSATWASELEAAGLAAANTISLAAATFGLVAGSLVGGPVGRFLIEHHHLKPDPSTQAMILGDDHVESKPEINEKRLTSAAYQILITIAVGSFISSMLKKTGMSFPASVGAMTAAAIFRNIADHNKKIDLKLPEISIISNISLLIFLALSMMTLKLWQLADLALPMLILLLAQVLLIVVFAVFVNFPIMGKNFDAAVTTVGLCGFGLGAVPTAMANMNSVEERYGRSPNAFFIVPLVGSLGINVVNTFIITAFLNFM